MSKKVYKYPTGAEIPEGAVYLSTQVEKYTQSSKDSYLVTHIKEKNLLVWHYFLVETNKEQPEQDTTGFKEE